MIVRFTGEVVSGKHIGRALGFPTANIRTGWKDLPENGVYAAKITIAGQNLPLPCVVNQGNHPTLPAGEPTIEAFLLDFSGDLYGSQVTMEYVAFLRQERKFPSLEALQAQIARDVARAREILL